MSPWRRFGCTTSRPGTTRPCRPASIPRPCSRAARRRPMGRSDRRASKRRRRRGHSKRSIGATATASGCSCPPPRVSIQFRRCIDGRIDGGCHRSVVSRGIITGIREAFVFVVGLLLVSCARKRSIRYIYSIQHSSERNLELSGQYYGGGNTLTCDL